MPYSDPAKQRAYQREWCSRNRSEWMSVHGPCIDCSGWDDLEVDHADASTKVSHRVWSWSRDRREVELAKCVVRCKPCHQKKSAGEKTKGEQSSWAKLTEEKVRMIRASSLTDRELAAQMSVHYSVIWQVRARRTWKHVS